MYATQCIARVATIEAFNTRAHMARQLQAEAIGLIGKYALNKSVSRRDWLVACGGVALLSETQATKPPLVLALDSTAYWYLGTMPAELIQSNGSNLNGIISSLNQYSAVVVAMDLACLDSQENLDRKSVV